MINVKDSYPVVVSLLVFVALSLLYAAFVSKPKVDPRDKPLSICVREFFVCNANGGIECVQAMDVCVDKVNQDYKEVPK